MIDEARIHDFWKWFGKNSPEIANWLSKRQTDSIDQVLTPRIKQLHSDLDWEVGPGISKPYMLTITSKSNRKLRPETGRIIEAAPEDASWEFYPALQPHPPQKWIEVSHQGQKYRVLNRDWSFQILIRSPQGRIDLAIVSPDLVRLPREPALHAVFIVLDALLGEDLVEDFLGRIEVVEDPDPGRDTQPVTELPTFLPLPM